MASVNSFLQTLWSFAAVFAISLVLSFAPKSAVTAATLPFLQSADWGTSTYSFAGAGAAMASNHDAFTTNPAGLAYYAQQGAVGGSYSDMQYGQSRWDAFAVDGTRGGIIGGFKFVQTDIEQLSRQSYIVSAAYRTPYGIVGGSVFAHRFHGVPTGGFGRGWHFTNSIGVLIPLVAGFSFGGYAKSPYDLEKNSHLAPSIHMGVMYMYPNALRATFESGRQFSKYDNKWYYATAVDLLVQQFFAVRGGYRWDSIESRSFWSAGAGIFSERAEFSGVFTRTVKGTPSMGWGAEAVLKF